MKISKRVLPIFNSPRVALALSTLFWSGNFIVGRALRDVPALTLNFWRWLLAFLILLPFTWRIILRERRHIIRHSPFLVFQALTGIAGFHICVYLALQQTAAINALLFFSTSPLIILFGSRLIHRTPVSRMQIASIVVSLCGVLIILTRGQWELLRAFRFNRGDLWMLLAVTLWSTYSVMLKRKPDNLAPIVLLDGAVLYSIIMMAPFYLLAAPQPAGFHFTSPLLAGLLYISLFASVIAYFLWNYGVAQLGPNKAGVYLNLMPLYGALLSVVFLNESLHGYHLLGAFFISGGIMLSQYAREVTSIISSKSSENN
jgi:drug/metabolite transporter (DMT)-like permease